MAAWRAFIRATVQVTRQLEADLQAAHKLSLAAYSVLVVLSEAPQRSARMSVLADETGLTRSAVTRLVDKLESDRLIKRVSCPSDARGSFAELTPEGYAALRRAYPTHLASVRAHVFDHLDPAHVTAFGAAMQALAEASSPGRSGSGSTDCAEAADCADADPASDDCER